jgi:hypothetical protein
LLLGRWWYGRRVLELLRPRSRLAVADHLPRTRRLKVAEGLRKLQRLVYDALVFLRVADFGVPREREVLAQRVALKTIVGKDATSEMYVLAIFVSLRMTVGHTGQGGL